MFECLSEFKFKFEFFWLEFELEIEIGNRVRIRKGKPAQNPEISPAHTFPRAHPFPPRSLSPLARGPRLTPHGPATTPLGPAPLQSPAHPASESSAHARAVSDKPGPPGRSFPSAAQRTRQLGRDPWPQIPPAFPPQACTPRQPAALQIEARASPPPLIRSHHP